MVLAFDTNSRLKPLKISGIPNSTSVARWSCRSFSTSDASSILPIFAPLMRRNIVRSHFRPILEKAGLPASIRLYDLRHTCATLLLAANEHPKVVSERLGHSNITLTLDTYSHVLPSMQQGASEKLERMLFEKTGTV
jgi:integrase